jgi:hypothetical protein
MSKFALRPDLDEKLKRFDREVLRHAHFEELTAKFKEQIFYPRDTLILSLIGPTGVGKSCLIERLVRQVTEVQLQRLAETPGIYPIISIKIGQQATSIDLWRALYTEILTALEETALAFQRVPKVRNLSQLRSAAIQALKARAPKAVIVDEAQHLAITTGGQQMLKQYNSIKSLADITGIPFLLVGPYELHTYLATECQIIRRSSFVHFDAYHWGRDEDRKKFKQAVLQIQHLLAEIFSLKADLLPNAEKLYSHCLGCVGSLTQIVRNATVAAVLHDQATLGLAQIESYAPPLSERIKMQEEIVAGRLRMLPPSDGENVLQEMLSAEPRKEEYMKPVQVKTQTRRRGRPGQRLPHRDLVGEVTYAS